MIHVVAVNPGLSGFRRWVSLRWMSFVIVAVLLSHFGCVRFTRYRNRITFIVVLEHKKNLIKRTIPSKSF